MKLMQSLLLGLWILKAEFLSDITISNKLFTLPKEDQYLPLSTELAYYIDVQPQTYRRHLFRYTYFYFATPSLYRDLIPLAGGTLLTSDHLTQEQIDKQRNGYIFYICTAESVFFSRDEP